MFIESLATVDPYFLTDPEIEEMAAAPAPAVSDEDMLWFLNATYVDPAEAPGPCCADPFCTCGGYVGTRHWL